MGGAEAARRPEKSIRAKGNSIKDSMNGTYLSSNNNVEGQGARGEEGAETVSKMQRKH